MANVDNMADNIFISIYKKTKHYFRRDTPSDSAATVTSDRIPTVQRSTMKKQFLFILNNNGEGALVPWPKAFIIPDHKVVGKTTFYNSGRKRITSQYEATIFTEQICKVNLDDYAGDSIPEKENVESTTATEDKRIIRVEDVLSSYTQYVIKNPPLPKSFICAPDVYTALADWIVDLSSIVPGSAAEADILDSDYVGTIFGVGVIVDENKKAGDWELK
jgi:hypothetical protein